MAGSGTQLEGLEVARLRVRPVLLLDVDVGEVQVDLGNRGDLLQYLHEKGYSLVELLGLGELDGLAKLLVLHLSPLLRKLRQRRQLDVGYGINVRQMWDDRIDTEPMMVIFWKLILMRKLGLEEDRAAIIADMFRIEMGATTSPVFVDRKTGKFKFREITYENNFFKN